jgi:hypothetical protein
VTHEADVARHARRIIRMRDGRVFSDLPTDEDVRRHGAPAPAPAHAAPEVATAAGVGA